MFLSLVSCCRPIADLPLTKNLSMVIKSIDAEEDSYRVVVAFKEKTTYDAVIQEVEATNSEGFSYSLVESFDTWRLEDPMHRPNPL